MSQYNLRVRLVLDTGSLNELRRQLVDAFSSAVKKEKTEERRERKREREEETRGLIASLSRMPFVGGVFGRAAEVGAGVQRGVAGVAQALGMGGGVAMAAQLGMIATGIFALIEIAKAIMGFIEWIVGIFRRASAVFDSVFQLLEMMWMMVLRPIGDFIGAILRPFLLLLLRFVIIPFYRSVMPVITRLMQTFTPERILETFPGIAKFVEFLKSFVEWIARGGAEVLVTIVLSLISAGLGLVDGLLRFLGVMETKAVPFAEKIQGIDFGKIVEAGKKLADWISSIDIGRLISIGVGLIGAIVSFPYETFIDALKKIGEVAWGAIVGNAKKFLDWFAGVAVEPVLNAMNSLWSFLKSVDVEAVIKKVGGVFSWIIGLVWEKGRDVVNNVLGWLSTLDINILKRFWLGVIRIMGDVWNVLGTKFVQIWNSIIDVVVSIYNALAGVGNFFIDLINRYFGSIGVALPRFPILRPEELHIGAGSSPVFNIYLNVEGGIYSDTDLRELIQSSIRDALQDYESRGRRMR